MIFGEIPRMEDVTANDDSGNCGVRLKDTEETCQSSSHCNPWLQLQTIKSFDKGSSFENICGRITLPENSTNKLGVNNLNSFLSTDVKDMGRAHENEMDSIRKGAPPSKDSQSIFKGMSRSILTQKANRKGHSCMASCKSRSHKTSLSEGDVQNSTSVHDGSSSLKNGTVSEAGGDSYYKDIVSHSQDPVEALSHFSPTSLLVESLIDQLCKLMEKDRVRQKQLYHVICDRLHSMRLIDDTYTIEEFQFMRSHYQRALYQLLAVAKSSTSATKERSIILPLPSTNINVDMKLSSEQMLEWSRYHHEYQELEYIAKGGFGHVYRVRNKLDGGEYAIKKIYLRYSYIEGFLRSLKEVKMLARLNHPNIVSYKAAWLEPLDSSVQKSRVHRTNKSTNFDASFSVLSINSRPPLPPSTQPVPGDSSDIVFQESSPNTDSQPSNQGDDEIKQGHDYQCEPFVECTEQDKKSYQSRKLLSELLGTDSAVFQPTASTSSNARNECLLSESDKTDTSDSSSEAVIFAMSKSKEKNSWSNVANHHSVSLRNWATLYVQMQLCQRTLRQWLDERNSSLSVYPLGSTTNEGSVPLSLFRKIVKGVEYIHSQGIVHHDIKPSNIFVNQNLKEVQVGDFGLSCCLLSRVDYTGTVGDYHGGVGTRIYAAPEQLRGKCTPKSDIYSLGIILLELLQPFHTDMERSKVIEKLRAGHLPSELSSTWPHAARLMSDMLANSPTSRPTATELLQRVEMLVKVNLESDVSSQLATKDETIRLLKEAVASRDQVIAELQRRLSLFENVDS